MIAISFPDVVRDLAATRGVSVERLLYDASDVWTRGTSVAMALKVLAGKRRPSVVLMEAIARAAGAEPNVFVEYRLAKTRERFDERVVGLDRAHAELVACAEALEQVRKATA